jgi:hypothetical protein
MENQRSAARIAAAVPGACVVHTDDIAWHHAVLDRTGNAPI